MRNILNEKPTDVLFGRLLEATRFVDRKSIVNKRILDIGCGFGWFELYAIQNSVKNITSIEVSAVDLGTAKKTINHPKVKFVVASALALPFPSNTFDTVVCFEVLEHLPEATEHLFFSEVKRVLKKGGILYLSTPSGSFFGRFTDPLYYMIGHRHYTKKQLKMYSNFHKFSILRLYEKGGWWSILSTYNMLISKWILKKRRLGEDFFIKHENEEYQMKNGFVNAFIKCKK